MATRVLGVLTLAILLLAACAAPSPSAPRPTAPPPEAEKQPRPQAEAPRPQPTIAPTAPSQAQAKLLRIAIARDESTLTPYSYVTGYPGWNLLNLLYDTLLFLDLDNKPVSGLATTFKASDDAEMWTVTLREGVKWHDGKPFRPEDVKFSFEYLAQHTRPRWAGLAKNVERIDVQGKTVAFSLKQPDPSFALRALADMPIFPRHLWQGVAEPKTFDQAIGTGPYRLVEHQADQFYRLEANPDYFLGRPRVDELVLPIIKDQAAIFSALKGGQIDATTRNLPPEAVKEFDGQAGFKLTEGPGFSSTLLQFNAERPPFDRREVRQAFDLAIDKQELVDILLLGHGTVGHPGYLHPASPLHDRAIKPAFDPAKARALLDALGFKDADGDGVREAAGRKMEHTLLVYANVPIRLRTAELISAMLKEVGIQANVKALDQKSVDELVWKDFDVSKPRDYDLSLWGWSAPLMLRPDPLGALVHSQPARGSLNIGGYRNPEGDDLVEQLAVTVDPEKRTRLVRRLEALVAREVPFVTLFYEDLLYPYRHQAFDGWAFQKGRGIFHKLSFLQR